MNRKKIFVNRLVITGIVCLLFKFAYGQEPDTWFTYRNDLFGFAVDFPGKPDSSEQTVNSAVGLLTMHMYQFDRSADDSAQNIFYTVNYTRYPDSANIKGANVDTFYLNSIKGMLASMQSDLLEEKVIYIGGYEGRELRIDFQKGLAIITERLVLADNRYYVLLVITENEKDRNPYIRKFLDSLRILP